MVSTVLGRVVSNQAVRSFFGLPFLRVNKFVWDHIPEGARASPMGLAYGRCLHRLTRLRNGGSRHMSIGTHFMRNRAELAFIGRVVERLPRGATFRVANLGCSIGAEAVSMVWVIRSRRPDVVLDVVASDIDPDVVDVARSGVYGGSWDIFDPTFVFRLSDRLDCEMLLERLGHDRLKVRAPWHEPIQWRVLDALSPATVELLGPRDLVVANRFLCHMAPDVARRCLRNVIDMVKPGGTLIVAGADLDVRGDVTREHGLVPIDDDFDGLYSGDRTLSEHWPFHYAGQEPLDKSHPNWRYRAGVAFRKPD